MNEGSGRPPGAARAPRAVGWLALAGVSLIAGIASYFHALAVVQAAGASGAVAYLVPALADLVILGASADLLAASRAGHPRPPLTMAALSVGVVVTLAMNVAAGWHHGLGGRLVAGWPALAFILALESLAGLVRRGRGGAFPPENGSAPAAPGHPEPFTADDALRALIETMSQRKLADMLGVPRSRVAVWAARVAPVAEEPPAGAASPANPDAPAGARLNGSGHG